MVDDYTVTVWVGMLQSEESTPVNSNNEMMVTVEGKYIAELKSTVFPSYQHISLRRIKFYTPIKCG